MPPRRVVYTCLFGGYETLLDQPAARDSDLDLVCFTDDPTLSSDCWQLRVVASPLPADQNRASRRPKILAHEYLDDYDESLYLDQSVLLTVPPERVFDAWLPDDVPLALLRHSFRGPVREEFAAVQEAGFDAAAVLDEQFAAYARHCPAALDAQTLWGGLLLRRHGDPLVRRTMTLWWEQVLRYSRRDQLSLPLALLHTGLPYRAWPVDNHRSDLHEWPRTDLVRDPARGAPLPADPRVRISELEVELADAHRELDARAAALAGSAADRARLEAAVAELHASTSWRVTRPLRAASDAARRARAAIRAGGSDPR